MSRVWDLGFRVWGSGFRVQGFGLKVHKQSLREMYYEEEVGGGVFTDGNKVRGLDSGPNIPHMHHPLITRCQAEGVGHFHSSTRRVRVAPCQQRTVTIICFCEGFGCGWTVGGAPFPGDGS